MNENLKSRLIQILFLLLFLWSLYRDVAENYGDEAEDSDPEWDDPNTAREVELSIEDQDIASTDGLF